MIEPLCVQLRLKRMRSDLTLREVSERAGMSLQQISRYEWGREVPGLTNLRRWAAALDCDIELVSR